MSTNPPPFKAQSPEEVTSVVKELSLATSRGNSKKTADYSCRKSTFAVTGSNLSVESWKFQDWDFKKPNLPSYARGLFTCKRPEDDHYEIVIRGYDKFFNTDEVQRTKWPWIEEHTQGPYEVTVKENGCIIFISGLPDGTLLVCSKHSTGVRDETEVSHAIVGERWVDRQLQKVGKTRKDLAKALRDANATAVAELCDDSFEEHILAYEGDSAGLYLHGINLNLPKFATYPAGEVHKFADTWGFKKIDFFEMKDTTRLRHFLEEAAETGSWDGKDVEGFVIRCKARDGPEDTTCHDWFFKYKFEEPYLMYRQWRECTKAMINGKQPKVRKHEKITKEYLTFAASYFRDHPGTAEEYQANHGIIKVRNAFLAAHGLRGSDIIKQVAEQGKAGGGAGGNVTENVVLVPIATIGCGKTTIAIALTKLFGWGHLQNDNITGKGNRGSRFAAEISMGLLNSPVVIADRNNHQKRERKQIFDDVSRATPEARFVALHYVHERPDVHPRQLLHRIRKATQARVFARGDNHQTIQAASLSRVEIEGIMEGFLRRFEPLDIDSSPDSTFDSHIDLDPEADSRTNLETVVTTLKVLYPRLFEELPTNEEYDEAIEAALKNYTVETKHSVGRAPKPKDRNQNKRPQAQLNIRDKGPRKIIDYFCISVPSDVITSTLDKVFSSQPEETARFYNQLRSSGRVQQAFHVTLIHRASSRQFPTVWEFYQQKLVGSGGTESLGKLQLVLERIVWNGRIMAITVKLQDEGLKTSNPVNHITIGTASQDIKPKESNDMLAWMKDGGEVNMLEVPDWTVVEGVVKAIEAKW